MHVRWDNRRSGRTTKALAAAFRLAYEGRHVVFVSPNPDFFKYCKRILEDLGATSFNFNVQKCRVMDGSILFLQWDDSQHVDPRTFLVKMVPEANVVWDHESVRRAHNRALVKFHEWD